MLKQGLTTTDLQQFQQWQRQQKRLTEKVENPEKQKKERKKRKKRETADVDEFNPAFLSSEELLEKKKELRQKMEADLAEELLILEQIELLKNTIKEATKYSFL